MLILTSKHKPFGPITCLTYLFFSVPSKELTGTTDTIDKMLADIERRIIEFNTNREEDLMNGRVLKEEPGIESFYIDLSNMWGLRPLMFRNFQDLLSEGHCLKRLGLGIKVGLPSMYIHNNNIV